MLAKTIRESVTFADANLIDEHPFSLGAPWDVVFCRNVLMYLDERTMHDVVDRITKALHRGDGSRRLVQDDVAEQQSVNVPSMPMRKDASFAAVPL